MFFFTSLKVSVSLIREEWRRAKGKSHICYTCYLVFESEEFAGKSSGKVCGQETACLLEMSREF